MKQIWPNYSYSPTTNVLTLTGLNIDRDQLLLVSAPERGRIMYNFADSTVTASAFTAGANTGLTLVASTAGLTTTAALVIYYDDQVSGISGTVTANISEFINEPGLGKGIGIFSYNEAEGNFYALRSSNVDVGALKVEPISLPAISGTVAIGTALPAGTNRIGVVTIGAGTVTIGAGTAQIGSVTASISGTVPVSGTFFQGTQPVSLASLPTLAAGTAQIGSVTASISGTVPISISSVTVGNSVTIGSLPAISGTVTANTFAVQGTAVTTSNFTSTTASTVLASYNATREVLTIFNEGAGNLHIAPGATCTTIAYQVRLSSGDYYEVPNHQTTITHSAVFATAGTARVTEVS